MNYFQRISLACVSDYIDNNDINGDHIYDDDDDNDDINNDHNDGDDKILVSLWRIPTTCVCDSDSWR